MRVEAIELTFEVELGPGEQLTLPRSLVESVGPGRWVITLQSLPTGSPTRDHAAFLRGYGPEDEGLYDESRAG
jgi:hypothetical protein